MSKMGDLVVRAGIAFQKRYPEASWEEAMENVRYMSLQDVLWLITSMEANQGDDQNDNDGSAL